MSIFLLAFGLLFVVAVLGRLVGLQWRDLLPGAENSDGISDGVKAAVYTFMSHLI
jgi:light-harvesting complex 1 beta chain